MTTKPLFQIILNAQTPKVLGKTNPETDRELLAGFTMFCKSLDNCAGLAANQVEYKGKRIKKRFFLITDGKKWYPVLNPKIIKKYGEPIRKTEGCKTWPGKGISAMRYLKIDLKYQDENGKEHTYMFEGFGAQVIQHEMDRLNGVKEEFTVFDSPKIGRNDKCKCGSGLKWKNCCMGK